MIHPLPLIAATTVAPSSMNFRSLWRRLEQRLAQSRAGRIVLNLTALIRRPRKARFLSRGIRREFVEMFARRTRR